MINGYFFQSDLFKIQKGEDEETNPECYGKELGQWLCDKFSEIGYEVELIAEDWGWCVMCDSTKQLLWVGCRCLGLEDIPIKENPGDPPDGSEVIWNVHVETEISFFSAILHVKKYLGKLDTTTAVIKLKSELLSILENEPGIRFCDSFGVNDRVAKLIERWKSESLEILPGVSPERITEFEQSNHVVLPNDMREYFLRVNGMREDWHDESFNYFWPLEKLKTIAEENPENADKFEESSKYFMFADHSIRLSTMAIRLSPDPDEPNTIVSLYADFGKFEVEECFHSFSDFLEAYNKNPLSAF